MKGHRSRARDDGHRDQQGDGAGSLDALDTPPRRTPASSSARISPTQLHVKVGDTRAADHPRRTLTPFGPIMPPRRVFKVVGMFSLGLYEFDCEYAFVDLDVAERMLGKDQPDFIELRLDDMFAAQQVADAIPTRLGADYIAQDWADMNKSLFSALWLEKMAISITIGLIVMVAALNIVASLVLLVMEKSRDIAILKTMGSVGGEHPADLHAAGADHRPARHIAGAHRRLRDHLRARSLQVDSRADRRLSDLLRAVHAAAARLRRSSCSPRCVICFVATIYPSRQASKLDPAQALRYQ